MYHVDYACIMFCKHFRPSVITLVLIRMNDYRNQEHLFIRTGQGLVERYRPQLMMYEPFTYNICHRKVIVKLFVYSVLGIFICITNVTKIFILYILWKCLDIYIFLYLVRQINVYLFVFK